MQTKIAISSHKDFCEKTFTCIVQSLIESGVPKQDIYFFIGGHAEYKKIDSDVNVWEVNHNSIDFTGLISVLDLDIKSDRWFLLHDTLYVGPDFYRTILYMQSDCDTIDMSSLWPKNMGSYSQKYLPQISDILLTKYKNVSTEVEDAHVFKTMNVDTENCFLKKQEFYCTDRPYIINDKIDFYKSNNLRSIQYYPTIDIYKIQSYTNYPGNYNLKI